MPISVPTRPNIFSSNNANPFKSSTNKKYPSTRIHCTSSNNERIQKPNKDHHEAPRTLNVERRDLLLGLGGGLCGAAMDLAVRNKAVAAPVAPPDIEDCGHADLRPTARPVDCCPPYSMEIFDFKPCDKGAAGTLRRRRPAHLVDHEYVDKYAAAVGLMKQLPPSDPRNFMQQANVHCAYCDAAYDQVAIDYSYYMSGIWLLLGATPVEMLCLHRRSSWKATIEMHCVSTCVAPGRSQIPALLYII